MATSAASSTRRDAQREGYAIAVINRLFPHLRTAHPAEYASDVTFLYDWQLRTKGSTYLDPLNLNKHGDYADPAHSLNAAVHYIHQPRQAHLLHALSTGDVRTTTELPAPLDNGLLAAPDPKAVTLGGILSNIPDATGRVFGDIGSGAVSGAQGIAGIGSWFSKNILIVVLLVVVILIVKK